MKKSTIEKQEKYKRWIKNFFLVFIICAIVIVGFWCVKQLNRQGREKTFEIKDMRITLTNEFKEAVKLEKKDCDLILASKNVIAYFKEDSWALYTNDYSETTEEEYAEIILRENEIKDAKIKTEKGTTYSEYEYENTDTNKKYYHFCAFYIGDEAFWTVQFTTEANKAQEMKPQFIKWAKTVEFSE